MPVDRAALAALLAKRPKNLRRRQCWQKRLCAVLKLHTFPGVGVLLALAEGTEWVSPRYAGIIQLRANAATARAAGQLRRTRIPATS